MIPLRKLGKSHCKYERMFFRLYEGASRQQHKEQVWGHCHCNMARRCVLGFWSLRTNFTRCHRCCLFPLSLLLRRWLLFMQKRGLGFICPSQRRAAHVVLYVNGAPFVRVLHMSITPSFNPSLCLGSGTFRVACVQGLAARVAVTAFNLQQTCSSATHCFECICIENTIRVLDFLALHMHSFITSHNKRQVCKGHIACHAFPQTSRYLCVSRTVSCMCSGAFWTAESEISNKKAVYLRKQSFRDWIQLYNAWAHAHSPSNNS